MRLGIALLLLTILGSCSPKASSEENTLAQISDPEVMKFAVNGKRLYENYCGNCHQADGRGLGKLIPPLRDSDYFKASVHRAHDHAIAQLHMAQIERTTLRIMMDCDPCGRAEPADRLHQPCQLSLAVVGEDQVKGRRRKRRIRLPGLRGSVLRSEGPLFGRLGERAHARPPARPTRRRMR